jgi:DHA3 family macrolide efflux protein-like MFS transporter
LVRDFNLYLFFMTLAGLPMPFWTATSTTLLQELIAPEMQGRVFGVQGLLVNAVMPIGVLVFGPLADVISVETLLVVTSLFLAVPGLWIWFYRQPRPTLSLSTSLETTQPHKAAQPGD